uniref:Chitin-binding type-2 domain-containing protein n=1 Tax=Lepeophtheirus salmonis TaxID=72036 RepID=A0A0K2V8K2_LEPSM
MKVVQFSIISTCFLSIMIVHSFSTISSPTFKELHPMKCYYTTLLPNPNDCKTYMQCSNGKDIIRKCPNTLHFSFKHQRCVYPSESECDDHVTTTPLLPQSTCEDSCTDHKCSEEFETWGNPENIATYYECSFNCACLINCPLGLVYDSNAAYCKEPDCSTQPESPACSAIPINSKVVRNVQFFNEPLCEHNGNTTCTFENSPSTTCPWHFFVCFGEWTCKFTCNNGYVYDEEKKSCVRPIILPWRKEQHSCSTNRFVF